MLRSLPSDDSRRLLEFFNDCGYTLDRVRASARTEHASLYRATVPYLLEKTAEPSPFHTLARWFAIGVAIPEKDARAQLPEWAIGLLIESGMLRARGESLEPAVMLSPLDVVLVASDPVPRWVNDPAELVLWPNPTTEQLFHLTVRRPFSSALDLGCGCGLHALAATQHCERVLATDISRRAVEFTAFNASLNGIRNVECAAGDCFAPAAGRAFDLIVANPPFFVAPGFRWTYCENDLELDLFCRRLAREAPAHLNESGFFQMICEWVEIEGQPWRERIAEWMESSGCDAWVIRQYVMSPVNYADEREKQCPPGPASADFVEAWLAYAQEKKIAAVHGGLVTMRKRSGRNWLRIEEEPVSLRSPIGDLILAGFAARDVLESHSDGELLNLRPRLASEARLVRVLGPSGEGWSARSLRLQLSGARPRQIDIDGGVAQFLGQLTGAATLGEHVHRLVSRADARAERVIHESIGVVRKLLAEGYLEI